MIIQRSIFSEDALDAAKIRAQDEGYNVLAIKTIKEMPQYTTFSLDVEPKYRNGMVPNCKLCESGFRPNHYPSENCQSGKHTHCACDTCF